MSFSDLLTSSRGPGVIGTLMALLVLVGFGTLYLFVFDEGLQGGGKKIEAVIRDDAVLLAGNQRQVDDAKGRIKQGQLLHEQALEIGKLKARAGANAKILAENTLAMEVATEALAAAEQNWEDYKDAYRASEWAFAKGEKIELLKTLSGKTYEDALVTGVDHTGMRIMISSGPTTVGSTDLPLGLQDRFQFSAEKKAVVEDKRDKDFEDLSGDVEIATLAKKGKDKLEEIRILNKAMEESNNSIQRAAGAEPILIRRVDAIRAELAEEQSKMERRSSSRMQGINRTPQIREMLRVADNKVTSNRRSITGSEREIRDAKRDIAKLQQEVDQVKADIAMLAKQREEKKNSETGTAGQ